MRGEIKLVLNIEKLKEIKTGLSKENYLNLFEISDCLLSLEKASKFKKGEWNNNLEYEFDCVKGFLRSEIKELKEK